MSIFKKKDTAVKASKHYAEIVGKNVTNPEFMAETQKVTAEAQKVYDALDGKYNVTYDVSTYKVKDTGEEKVVSGVSFNCFDSKNKDNKVSQMVSLSFNKEGQAYVKMASYDGSKWNDVETKDMYESTKLARIKLEKAGICKEFLTKERPEGEKSDKVYTPAENARYEMGKVVKEYNKTNKAVNKDGKEVGEYYLSDVTDTSYKTKTGEDVAQETFELRNHKSVAIEINMQDGKVANLRVKDFSDYDFEQKAGDVQTATAYNLEYAKEKFSGLDQNLLEIIEKSKLEFRPYVKAEKEAEAPAEEQGEWDKEDELEQA